MKAETRYDIVSGLWKFSDEVKIEELVEIAEEWAKDENYIHLYIRGVSKDQNGIGFAYKLESEDDETRKKFSDEAKDALYKKFGLKFVGWDYASRTITIKGF